MKKRREVQLFLITLIVPILCNSQCLFKSSVGYGTLYKTTGNVVLDNKFNVEKYNIEKVFNVNVNLFIFDDSNSPNAIANCSQEFGYDGTVRFGKNLLIQELYSSSKGEIAVAGILAHEIAHILQCKYSSPYKRREFELQADFLAGYYMGLKKYTYGNSIRNFMISLFEKGDWSDPSHHGTPVERVNALMSGYNKSYLTAFDAYKESIDYIELILRREKGELYLNKPNFKVDYITSKNVYRDGDKYLKITTDLTIYNMKDKECYFFILFYDKNWNPIIEEHTAYNRDLVPAQLYAETSEEFQVIIPNSNFKVYKNISFYLDYDDIEDIDDDDLKTKVVLYKNNSKNNDIKIKRIKSKKFKSFYISNE